MTVEQYHTDADSQTQPNDLAAVVQYYTHGINTDIMKWTRWGHKP